MNSEVKICCAQCGGHISFPHEYLGQPTICPHCSQPIVLAAPTPIDNAPVLIDTGKRNKIFSVIKRKRVLVSTGILITFLGLILYCTQGKSPNIRYWNRVIKAFKDAGSLSNPDPSLMSYGHYDECAAQWLAHCQKEANLAACLRGISTRGIDEELVNNVLRLAELQDAHAVLDMDEVQIARQAKEYYENHDSASAMVLSFLRGAAGDPAINGYREARADADILIEKQQEVAAKGKTLWEQENELNAERAKIFVRLFR
jgi:hypothetical protein